MENVLLQSYIETCLVATGIEYELATKDEREALSTELIHRIVDSMSTLLILKHGFKANSGVLSKDLRVYEIISPDNLRMTIKVYCAVAVAEQRFKDKTK